MIKRELIDYPKSFDSIIQGFDDLYKKFNFEKN